jgi:hypothetical protein
MLQCIKMRNKPVQPFLKKVSRSWSRRKRDRRGEEVKDKGLLLFLEVTTNSEGRWANLISPFSSSFAKKGIN